MDLKKIKIKKNVKKKLNIARNNKTYKKNKLRFSNKGPHKGTVLK